MNGVKRTLDRCVEMEIEVAGTRVWCSPAARLLLETSRGTSSYSLVRGFSATEWKKAAEAYADLPSEGGSKKRVTLIDRGKRSVLTRAG